MRIAWLALTALALCACGGSHPGAVLDAVEEQRGVPLVSYTGSTVLRCAVINETVAELDEEARGSESAAAAATEALALDVRQGGQLVDFGQSQGGPFGILTQEELTAVAYVTHLPTDGWAVHHVRRCG